MPVRRSHQGGILIEFTLAIPVCIALLFFVNDHYRFYELKNKLKNSAYMAAGMIQHITSNQTDKQLTQRDLARIAYASCLNIFHTKSMFNPWPLGISFAIDIDWIKKVGEDQYQTQRVWGTTGGGNSPGNMTNGKDGHTETLTSCLNRYPELKPLQKDLVLYNNGDEKLIISCYYRPANFSKSKLGLFVMNLNFGLYYNTSHYGFGYHLIITPKPGLFPAK